MSELGVKMAKKRKDLGMTQNEFAEKLSVTRQTVSRWEAGTVMPDIDKIADIAKILNVSCDYLLKDEVEEEKGTASLSGISRLLKEVKGRKVKLSFFEEEEEPSLINKVCTVLDFEGNWMKVLLETKKESSEKLIPISSVRALEMIEEGL